MDSKEDNKPHAICIPAPAQGHINPMLKLAKILNSKGFDITFVNTEFNHQRLLRSQGPNSLSGNSSFRFETIPDGLPPPENKDATQNVLYLIKSLDETGSGPFKNLLAKVSACYSPVTCIVTDFSMGFTQSAAEELGIPEVFLWTSGAGSLICYDQYPNLIQKGLMPLKDPSYLNNGYLDTIVDCIPSMSGIRLKDIPTMVRMMKPGDEYLINFFHKEITRMKKSSGVIFNTFDKLEGDILDTLSSMMAHCFALGPLHLLEKNIIVDKSLASIKSNLWIEESRCLKWLDSKEALSVIYVNFGSIGVLTPQQLVQICWGLANSNHSFLWIIRPDLVTGDSALLPPEFLSETSDRGLLVSWSPQDQVLSHPSIGGYLTHSGWNSTIESISNGVPMICMPFFADQHPNCWLCCNKWGVAIELDDNVTSDEVSKLVIELMNGEKGKEMRKNAMHWKDKAQEACSMPSGSSMVNLDKLIHLLRSSRN